LTNEDRQRLREAIDNPRRRREILSDLQEALDSAELSDSEAIPVIAMIELLKNKRVTSEVVAKVIVDLVSQHFHTGIHTTIACIVFQGYFFIY
jgi:hypothetical protein